MRSNLTNSFSSSKQSGGSLGSFRSYLLVSHLLIFGKARKQDSKTCPQNSLLCRRYEVWSENTGVKALPPEAGYSSTHEALSLLSSYLCRSYH